MRTPAPASASKRQSSLERSQGAPDICLSSKAQAARPLALTGSDAERPGIISRALRDDLATHELKGPVDRLDPALRDRLADDFPPDAREEAERLLLTYESDYPNDSAGTARVRHAILIGAKGDLAELRSLVAAAQMDYRDVLYWTLGGG